MRIRAVLAATCLGVTGLVGCTSGAGDEAATVTAVVTPTPEATVDGRSTPGTPADPGDATTSPGAGTTQTTSKAGQGQASSGPGGKTPQPGPIIDASGAKDTAFATPSGNIVCAVFALDTPGAFRVRCDLLEHTWVLPPRPDDCEYDWGHGTYLESGQSGITCVSDSAIGSPAVGAEGTWWNGQPGSEVVAGGDAGGLVALSYGATMTFGPVSCLSSLDGLHCTDSDTGAGFDISRESYQLR